MALHPNVVRRVIEASVRPPAKLLGGCHPGTVRCSDARSYGSELRPCCRGHIRRIVADAAEALKELRLIWWADYGTLLGAVRNPMTSWADYPWLAQGERSSQPVPAGIIPHDKDADFGVLACSYAAVMRFRGKMNVRGYDVAVRRDGSGVVRSVKVRLSGTNHTNADFFFWYERHKRGTMYRPRYIHADTYKGREFHKDQAFPLTTVEWEGMTLPAPKDPAAFCEFRYGPNWRTPLQANNDGIRRGQG